MLKSFHLKWQVALNHFKQNLCFLLFYLLQVCQAVVDGTRPLIPCSHSARAFEEIIIQCWQHDMNSRPTMANILESLRSVNVRSSIEVSPPPPEEPRTDIPQQQSQSVRLPPTPPPLPPKPTNLVRPIVATSQRAQSRVGVTDKELQNQRKMLRPTSCEDSNVSTSGYQQRGSSNSWQGDIREAMLKRRQLQFQDEDDDSFASVDCTDSFSR